MAGAPVAVCGGVAAGRTGTGWLHVSVGPGHGVLAGGAAPGDVGRWMGPEVSTW